MPRLLRLLCATAGILSVFAFYPMTASADGGNPAPDRLGCIVRETGGLRFFDGSGRDLKTVAQDILAAAQKPDPRVGSPCVSGQVRNMPARVYAKLAAQYPGKYQPLDLKPLAVTAATQTGNTIKTPRYKYIGLDAFVPSGFFPSFFSISITEGGRVFGWIFDETSFTPYVSVYENGIITPLAAGFAYSGSRNGIVGGAVLLDISTFQQQAAIYRGNNVELIPALAGQTSSFVRLVNDGGTALVEWTPQIGDDQFALYENGKLTPVNFDQDILFAFPVAMNNNGIIAGFGIVAGNIFRGFRHDTKTGETMLLNPLPSDHDVFIGGINERGDIVGISIVFTGIEHIGVWHREGDFSTYFTEGTPENPAVGFGTKINDLNLIIVSDIEQFSTPNPNDIFLVPAPGLQMSMNALTGGVPPDLGTFPDVIGVNNRGKIIGTSQFGSINYLLEPTP